MRQRVHHRDPLSNRILPYCTCCKYCTRLHAIARHCVSLIRLPSRRLWSVVALEHAARKPSQPSRASRCKRCHGSRPVAATSANGVDDLIEPWLALCPVPLSDRQSDRCDGWATRRRWGDLTPGATGGEAGRGHVLGERSGEPASHSWELGGKARYSPPRKEWANQSRLDFRHTFQPPGHEGRVALQDQRADRKQPRGRVSVNEALATLSGRPTACPPPTVFNKSALPALPVQPCSTASRHVARANPLGWLSARCRSTEIFVYRLLRFARTGVIFISGFGRSAGPPARTARR